MDLELTGKVALITGGSKGIGLASAIEMASEGASVAICGRREDALAEAVDAIRQVSGSDNVAGIRADVSNPDDVAGFVAAAQAQFGRIDILVNNAGTSAARPFEQVTDDDWQADLDLKLMAAVRCSRAAIPHMRAVGGGRIINITAIQGKQPGISSTPTSVSRAAGIALTKAMSKELAKDNILVNTVCIGLVRSEQIERAALRFDVGLDEGLQRLGQNVPLGRIGEAREVAALITFLASGRGSYITGVAINADGGSAAVV